MSKIQEFYRKVFALAYSFSLQQWWKFFFPIAILVQGQQGWVHLKNSETSFWWMLVFFTQVACLVVLPFALVHCIATIYARENNIEEQQKAAYGSVFVFYTSFLYALMHLVVMRVFLYHMTSFIFTSSLSLSVLALVFVLMGALWLCMLFVGVPILFFGISYSALGYDFWHASKKAYVAWRQSTYSTLACMVAPLGVWLVFGSYGIENFFVQQCLFFGYMVIFIISAITAFLIADKKV